MKKRIDLILVELGLVRSRHQSKELILDGLVTVRGKKVNKPSEEFDSLGVDQVNIDETSLQKYVSRGGVKLEKALLRLNLDVKDFVCLDVGQSTGGFTDCLLQFGARSVFGIDVGHGQLSEKIKLDNRVRFLEGVNAKTGLEAALPKDWPREFDLVVVDVSFISLALVLRPIATFISPRGRILALVKPQYELGAERSVDLRAKLDEVCVSSGLKIRDYFSSELKGTDGTEEYFLLADKNVERI